MTKYREVAFIQGEEAWEFIDALDSDNPDAVEGAWCDLTSFDSEDEDAEYTPEAVSHAGESEELNDKFPAYSLVVHRGLGYVAVYFKE